MRYTSHKKVAIAVSTPAVAITPLMSYSGFAVLVRSVAGALDAAVAVALFGLGPSFRGNKGFCDAVDLSSGACSEASTGIRHFLNKLMELGIETVVFCRGLFVGGKGFFS